MISSEIFLMQTDKICREVFELYSDNFFTGIELKTFDDNSDGGKNPLELVLVRDQLTAEMEKSGDRFYISEPFFEEGKVNYFIINYSREEKKTFEKYQLFFTKLMDELFEYFIREYQNDNTYFYNGSINNIITRDAIDSLVTEISRRCCKNDGFSLYDNINLSLKNILAELSAVTYEKQLSEGLIYFVPSAECAQFQFEFNNYEEYGNFNLKNIRLLRKLLELTSIKNGTGIISDTNFIYGIGSVKEDSEYYSVTFDDDRRWTVYEKDNELVSIRNNSLVLISNLISKREFTNYAEKVFPSLEDSDELGNMYNIIKSLVKQKKGTILVVKKDAESFIKKYQDLCIVINPVKLDEKNVEKLSSIDGAIIMDENCVCYGFGAVLDGLDTGSGNRGRGSRFNSSERFFNLYKNEDNTDLMVFILSDDGNFNFFPEL